MWPPAVFLLATLSFADEVRLKCGGKFEGRITYADDYDVFLETNSGDIRLSAADIASIDREHESPIESYPERFERIRNSADAEAFCLLMFWCRKNGITKHAAELRKRVLELDPHHPHIIAEETVVRVEPKQDKSTEVKIREPKKPAKPDNVVCGPRLIPPLASVSKDGTIAYPPNSLPGPTYLGWPDGMQVPYWGIPPNGMDDVECGKDFGDMHAEFNDGKFLEALRTWKVVERENDVLLLPPNLGETKHWRLLWSLAPKSTALRGIEGVRNGKLKPKNK